MCSCQMIISFILQTEANNAVDHLMIYIVKAAAGSTLPIIMGDISTSIRLERSHIFSRLILQ